MTSTFCVIYAAMVTMLLQQAIAQLILRLQAVESEMSKPERLRESTKQGIANIMWAFATLSFYPAHFMAAVCVALEDRLPMCTDQELSNCLWACARLAHHPGQKLMDIFCHSLDALVSTPTLIL